MFLDILGVLPQFYQPSTSHTQGAICAMLFYCLFYCLLYYCLACLFLLYYLAQCRAAND